MKPKPHGFHREAEAEYVQAARDYAEISPELGGRFYDEMERLISEVCQWPGMYRHIRLPIRRHFSTEFPYASYLKIDPIMYALSL